jgi:hypothetical protein
VGDVVGQKIISQLRVSPRGLDIRGLCYHHQIGFACPGECGVCPLTPDGFTHLLDPAHIRLEWSHWGDLAE